MDTIGLAEARTEDWDVVVAGSSFAAMFFLQGLPEGLRVLVVEKGQRRSHAERVAQGWPVRDEFAQRNTSGHQKDWVAYTTFGGNSNYWWGDSPRLHPDDFVLGSKFGVAEDWPLRYEDLEPWWVRAEELMEIAGGGSDHLLPRSRPFPLPPHRLSRSDHALRRASDLWVPLPSARSTGGTRAACCANGVCGICPIDSKFTIENGFATLDRPGVRYLLGTEVRAVETEGGRAAGLLVRSAAGEEALLRGQVTALATNAIYNAAILLRSGLGGPATGRYLNEQATKSVVIDTATLPNFFGGTSETLHGYAFYHDVDRTEAAAVLMENTNAPPIIRAEPGRWDNRLRMLLVAEDIPQPQNRVILEDDRPLIEWTGHDDYAFRGLDRAAAGLVDLIPDELESITLSDLLPSEAHIQGTHRMGADPATSVVDDRLRLHGMPDLLVLGAGAFPTCSPANPTLTICALSLRAAEALA